MMYSVFWSTPALEARYVETIMHDWQRLQRYPHCKWPPEIRSLLQAGASPDSISTEQVQRAVETDTENLPPPQTVIGELNAELASKQELLEAFFPRHFELQVPSFVFLCVTRYGAGGSYHPERESNISQSSDAISIRYDQMHGRTVLQTLAHETIHLIIERPVVRKNLLPDNSKEALVDKICSCKELAEIFGRLYPMQSLPANSLPQHWHSLIRWRVTPTWK